MSNLRHSQWLSLEHWAIIAIDHSDWDVSQRSKISITSETLHNHRISRANLSAYISHSPQPTPSLQWRTKAFPLLCCRRREAFVMSNTCHTVSPSITPTDYLIATLRTPFLVHFKTPPAASTRQSQRNWKLPRFSLFLCIFLLQSFADFVFRCTIASDRLRANIIFSDENRNTDRYATSRNKKFQFKECKLFYSFF